MAGYIGTKAVALSTTTGNILGDMTVGGTTDVATLEFNSLSGTGAVTITDILDEDNLASNSATKLATQQSIKAYVDAQVDTVDTLAEILAIGNRTAGAGKIEFRDAAIFINSSADGQLDLVADTEIQIAATTIDINGAVDVSGAINVGVDDTGHDVKFFGATASAYMQWDASQDDLILGGVSRLGIATASPQAELYIGNADGSSRSIVVHTQNNGNARLRFREGANINSGFNEYSIGMFGNANALTFEIQGRDEAMRLDGSGNLTITDGNLIVGTAGHGIDFSAVTHLSSRTGGGNELLDRYEEGTYSPVLTGAGSGTDAGTGSYVIVGKLITVSVTFNNIGTGLAGNLSVNLPATANPQGAIDMYLPVQWYDLDWNSAAKAQYGYISDGSATLVPYYSKDAAASAIVQGDELKSSTYLRFTITYQIT